MKTGSATAGRQVVFAIGNLTDSQEWALRKIRELFTDPARTDELQRWLDGRADLQLDQESDRIRITYARRNWLLMRDAVLNGLHDPVNRN